MFGANVPISKVTNSRRTTLFKRLYASVNVVGAACKAKYFVVLGAKDGPILSGGGLLAAVT